MRFRSVFFLVTLCLSTLGLSTQHPRTKIRWLIADLQMRDTLVDINEETRKIVQEFIVKEGTARRWVEMVLENSVSNRPTSVSGNVQELIDWLTKKIFENC